LQPGAGDSNRRAGTSPPVEDWVGEVGVYMPSSGEALSAPLSIGRACGFERGHMGPGLYWARP
jgi:hypothetical protein